MTQFLGGLAFFLYGQFLLERDLQKTSRIYLRSLLKLLARHKVAAILFGGFLAVGMQSSTVPVFTLLGLINYGVLQLGQAISIVLGAGIGTTITVQLISFKVTGYALWFIIIGFILSRISKYARGELLMGFGFMFFGLNLIGNSVVLFKETAFGNSFLNSICTSQVGNMVGAFILTIISQSTLSAIALGIVLMREGGLGIYYVIPVILGAHVGAGILPFIYTLKLSKARTGMQLTMANLIYRIAGVLLFLPLLGTLARLSESLTLWFGAEPTRQLANAHTFFTITTVAVFMPFIVPYTKFIKRIFPEKKISLLDLKLDRPKQEILDTIDEKKIRLAEDVHKILNDSIRLWEEDSLRIADKTERECFSINVLADGFFKYVTGLPKEFIGETHCIKILETVNNLERIANITRSGLANLARKRILQGLSFSIEGLDEIIFIHKYVVKEFDLLLRILEREKVIEEPKDIDKEIEKLISDSFDSHITRMYKGFHETKGTISIHNEALTFLENIHWNIKKILSSMEA